jgi:uncharacterized protein
MDSRLRKVMRWLLVGTGTAAVVTGLVGIVVPVLPTTPFLLLGAICYMHSSPRLYKALVRGRFIGAYLRNYLEGRGMSVRVKIWTLGLLWVAIGCSAAFATHGLLVRLILLAVLVGVTVHVLLIKTIRKEVLAPSKVQDKRKCSRSDLIKDKE